MSTWHIEIWRENFIVYGVGKGTSNIMPRVMKIEKTLKLWIIIVIKSRIMDN